MPSLPRKSNQTFRDCWHNRLSTLVVGYVSLGNADAISQFLLREF